jgi:hypothetical protein
MRVPYAMFLLLALAGCPKGGSSTSGDSAPTAWLLFDVFEAGTDGGLSAVIWPEDTPEAGEIVLEGAADQDIRYEGLGRTDSGFVLPFVPGRTAVMMVWARGHELKRVEVKIAPGRNLVEVSLKATAVPEDQLPDAIQTDVLPNLPSNIRRGS